jgi:hypothetical protein
VPKEALTVSANGFAANRFPFDPTGCLMRAHEDAQTFANSTGTVRPGGVDFFLTVRCPRTESGHASGARHECRKGRSRIRAGIGADD